MHRIFSKKNTCLLKWQQYSVNSDRNVVQLKKCMFLRRNRKCLLKLDCIGFGTVASGIPFLLKENGEKVLAASRDQLEIAKVLVKDDEEKKSSYRCRKRLQFCHKC